MNRTNVHICPSGFRHASRILKGTQSVIEQGLADRVVVLARIEPGTAEREPLDERRLVMRVPLFFSRFRKNLFTEALVYFEYLFRAPLVLRGLDVTHVNAHSLSVLPAAVILKVVKRCKVIYDAHELETERAGLKGARKLVSKLLERSLMPFVAKTIVVGPSIAEWYRGAYPGKEFYVVRNIPRRIGDTPLDRSLLRRSIGVSDDTIIFLYLGIHAVGRGIERLTEALCATRNPNVVGVFMGNGPLVPHVQAAEKRTTQVRYLPPVEPEEVLAYSCGADIGYSAIENTCLSYDFSLPNKFFELLMVGVPVLIFPRVDQQAIVEKCGNGWVIEESSEALLKFLDELTVDDLTQRKRRAEECSGQYDWDNDASQYADIFEGHRSAKGSPQDGDR